MSVFTFDRRIIDASEYPWGYRYPWTPARITTALWLDAADSRTITLVSSVVSQWNDKSGNGRHATQANTGYRPGYVENALDNKPVVRFDGKGMNIGAPLFSNNLDTYFVLKAASVFSSSNLIFGQWASGVAGRWVVSGLALDDTKARMFLDGSAAPVDSTVAITQWCILQTAKANMAVTFRVNGANAGSGNLSASAIANQNFSFGGGDNGTAAHWYGDIAEIVAFSASADIDTRQKLEGYLAHKWNLTGNLPSDHPYKTRAPRA